MKGEKHGRDMKIQYCSNYEQMSQMAFDSILSDLKIRSRQLICVSTGYSPKGTYNKLAEAYKIKSDYFNEISIIKLDEWGGLCVDDVNSCEAYILLEILDPLHIPDERFISFNGKSKFPDRECKRVQKEIEEKGPIDLCILGLGRNGHLGFIEPSDSLSANCHLAKLSPDSLQHQMIDAVIDKPRFGLTLGMANIMQSKKIILLITGTNKEQIIENLLKRKITTNLPASFLWMHPNVECYIDSESLHQIK